MGIVPQIRNGCVANHVSAQPSECCDFQQLEEFLHTCSQCTPRLASFMLLLCVCGYGLKSKKSLSLKTMVSFQMVLESTSSSSSSAQKNSNESDDDVIEILDEHTLNNSASTQPLKSSPNNETHCTVSDSLNSQQHSGTSTLLALPNVCNEDEEIPFYTRELINKLPNYFQDVKLELSSSAVLNKLNEVQHLPYPKANRDSLDSSSEQNRHFTTSDSAENKKYLPYYINNFLEILKVVLDTPDDFFLFNYDDLEILRNFYLLSSMGVNCQVIITSQLLATHKCVF